MYWVNHIRSISLSYHYEISPHHNSQLIIIHYLEHHPTASNPGDRKSPKDWLILFISGWTNPSYSKADHPMITGSLALQRAATALQRDEDIFAHGLFVGRVAQQGLDEETRLERDGTWALKTRENTGERRGKRVEHTGQKPWIQIQHDFIIGQRRFNQ